MQQSQLAMNNIETLQQNQGYLTSQQQAEYADAKASYAAAQNSMAQAGLAGAQTGQVQQQVAQLTTIQNAFKSIYGNNWAEALTQAQNGKNPTVTATSGTPTSGNGLKLGTASNGNTVLPAGVSF